MEGFSSKYLGKTLTLKRELSFRIYPDKTELSEDDYKQANNIFKIQDVCQDLLDLVEKLINNEWYQQ